MSRHLLAVALALMEVAASCSHSPAVKSARTMPRMDYCQMAVAALRETIKANDKQPYGMEDLCVESLASASGKIYVDARFMGAVDLEDVPERSCSRDKYVVRFDFKHFERSPSDGVVLLMVSAETPSGREFTAMVEESNWPSKQPGEFAMTGCGSAFGLLRRSKDTWTAFVVPPPQPPDAL